jgi:hypothetical protein
MNYRPISWLIFPIGNIYFVKKKEGEQQVASCQAAVQKYQARSAAQQQGIQTLGNAIGDLLAPISATPIDSQNDLANYEDQQKGQAVLGDDSVTSSSPDDAATKFVSRMPFLISTNANEVHRIRLFAML